MYAEEPQWMHFKAISYTCIYLLIFRSSSNFFSFSGVRSVSFRREVLTVGTGRGSIMFFDISAGKFLPPQMKIINEISEPPSKKPRYVARPSSIFKLSTGEGYLVSMY